MTITTLRDVMRENVCDLCQKIQGMVKCNGCSKNFCLTDLSKHMEALNDQMSVLEDEYNQFYLALDQLIINSSMRTQFQVLKKQLTECRRTNAFIETDIQYFEQGLQRLKMNLADIHQSQPSSVCNSQLAKDFSSKPLYRPARVRVTENESMFVADFYNHRILRWKKNTKRVDVVVGGRGRGTSEDQLNRPTDVIWDEKRNALIICNSGNRSVIRWSLTNTCQKTKRETLISNIRCWGLTMDHEGYLYVTDLENHQVKRYSDDDQCGTVVAGGHGQGDALNQLNGPRYVFVDQDQSVYVSDTGNHRVMKWEKDAQQGIIVAGGHGCGNDMNQLSFPYGIAVGQDGTVYVSDHGNHRVMRWSQTATEGDAINGSHLIVLPACLWLDSDKDLYVTDWTSKQVSKFNLWGERK